MREERDDYSQKPVETLLEEMIKTMPYTSERELLAALAEELERLNKAMAQMLEQLSRHQKPKRASKKSKK